MKKLMIAAAAAAMIGVAEAVTVNIPGYDYTATVKTTKGKGGKGVTDTYRLGKGAEGWWYNDPIAQDMFVQFGQTKHENDATIPCFFKDASKYLWDVNTSNRVEGTAIVTNRGCSVTTALSTLMSNYGVPSAGVYCETVKVETKAVCYRVAGSKKYADKLAPRGCCADNGYSFVALRDSSVTNIVWEAPSGANTATFVQRFGSETETKASKVEIFAATVVPAWDNFEGFIAGQGTWDLKNDRIATISGNIVGKIDAPTCEACCKDGSPAIAFVCDDVVYLPVIKDDTVPTAAFGTFRIKYNAKCEVIRY